MRLLTENFYWSIFTIFALLKVIAQIVVSALIVWLVAIYISKGLALWLVGYSWLSVGFITAGHFVIFDTNPLQSLCVALMALVIMVVLSVGVGYIVDL